LAALLLAPLAVLIRDAFSHGFWELVFALGNPDAWHSIRFSLALAFAATAVNVIAGTAVGWVLARHRFPGRSLLTALLNVPLSVPPFVAGYSLVLLFGRQGYLRWFVNVLGLRIAFAWPGMLLATVFVTLPFVAKEVLGALQRTEKDVSSGGASPREVFRQVTVPDVRWALLHGAALTLAASLGEFGAVYAAGGDPRGSTETAALFVARALDARMTAAVAGVSLCLAGVSFVFYLTIDWLRDRSRAG
jgi:sulfate transport system permease protein